VHRTVVGDVLDNDVDLVTVQKLLGHPNVRTAADIIAGANGQRRNS
jgi:site-specific recombinase XerD